MEIVLPPPPDSPSKVKLPYDRALTRTLTVIFATTGTTFVVLLLIGFL